MLKGKLKESEMNASLGLKMGGTGILQIGVPSVGQTGNGNIGQLLDMKWLNSWEGLGISTL